MNVDALLIALIVLLPAIAVVTWSWFAMARFEEDMGASSSFDTGDFEIGAPASELPEAARWPIPG